MHDDPTITRWWEATSVGGAAQDAVVGECLITGAHAPLAKTHKPKIKGVVGGKAEALLVSYNETAYESLGLRQSLNAPVSEAAAFRYATALNALLDGPRRERHRVVVADTTVVFWTGRPSATEDVFAQFFRHGDMPQKNQEQAQDDALRKNLQRFCAALRTGDLANSKLADSPPITKFFILGISPNAARISVRFFHCSTIAELWRNLRQHYDDIRIDGRRMVSAHSDPEFPPMWLLLAQTARESNDAPPILAGGLLLAIINKTPYPRGLYAAVMRRIAIERDVNYLRACIIKGYLVRNNNMEISMSLDITRKETSYRLGRLFAALEKTQKDALGDKISATIRDRFYGAASATPRRISFLMQSP